MAKSGGGGSALFSRFNLNDHFRMSIVLSGGNITAPHINDGRNTGDALCLM